MHAYETMFFYDYKYLEKHFHLVPNVQLSILILSGLNGFYRLNLLVSDLNDLTGHANRKNVFHS